MVGSKKATLQKTLHKFTLFVNHKTKYSYWIPRTQNDRADRGSVILSVCIFIGGGGGGCGVEGKLFNLG